MPSLGGSGSYGGDDPTGGYSGGYSSADKNKKNKSSVWGEVGAWIFDGFTGMMIPTAALNAGLYGLTGETVGDQFAKAVSGPWGAALPGPMVGGDLVDPNRPPLGSVSDGASGKNKKPAEAEKPAAKPPEKEVEPVLDTKPTFAQQEVVKRRKRIGRQQTIVAGRLRLSGDAYKPTLLGS